MSILRILVLPLAALADAGNFFIPDGSPSRVRQLLEDEKQERLCIEVIRELKAMTDKERLK